MAAGVEAQAQPAGSYVGRTRGIWSVLALSMTLFCAVCAVAGSGVYGFLTSLTRPEHARVELVRGTQLSVVPHGQLTSQAVSRDVTVSEGDEIHTGEDTEANVDLFDYSTLLLSFGSVARLDSLHTGRFFGSKKEIAVYMPVGTALFSTADTNGDSAANYNISTDQADVQVASDSTVRVPVVETDGKPTTVVAATIGSAVVTSNGKQVQLHGGFQTTVAANSPPTDPEPEAQE